MAEDWVERIREDVVGSPKDAKDAGPNVFVHVKTDSDGPLNFRLRFMRLPVVGELIAVTDQGPHFSVESVVHIPFNQEDIGAEIWCRRVLDSDVGARTASLCK